MVLGTLYAKKQPLQKLAKIMLGIGLVSEFIKVFYYILANEATHGGVLPKTDLPFHLCSIQIIFIAIVVYSKSDKFRELLLSFMIPSCLLGGLAALLIATTSSLNGRPILSVQYFGYHVAIMIFSLSLILGKQVRLTVKMYVNCLKFVAILMLGAIYINSILYDGVSNINFMYVVSPPQSGLPFLNEDHGWLVYMAHYGFLVIACITGCYAGPILRALKQRKQIHSKTAG
jgi:uncharacterized membrane protein YwaF